MVDTNDQRRRTVLKKTGLISVGGLAGLAGCLGDDDDDDDDDGDDAPADDDDGDDAPADDSDDSPDVDFPERDIEMIVSFGPGGGMDYYARLVMQYLPEYLPNDVDTAVQNVEGAGGRTGRNQAFTAEPDGYTTHHTHLESAVVGQLVYDVQYDIQEFTHLGSIASAGRSWFGRTEAVEAYDNWDALTAAINDGEVSVATQGHGGTAHLTTAVYGQISGDFDWQNVDFVHYGGTGEAVTGIIRGDADLIQATHDSALPYLDEDEVAMLFTGLDSDEFTTDFEYGIPEDVAEGTRAMLTNRRLITGPPGISDDITAILRDSFYDTLNDDDLIADAEEAERPLDPVHGDEVQPIVDDFYDLWQDNIDLIEELSD